MPLLVAAAGRRLLRRTEEGERVARLLPEAAGATGVLAEHQKALRLRRLLLRMTRVVLAERRLLLVDNER